MQMMYFKIHVEDVGWVDCVTPIKEIDEPEPLDIDFSIVGKCENFDMNRFELMGYSHEASIILQDCYESTKALWECFADAFENFSRMILKPIEDCFEKMFGDWYVGKNEKHFDGVYSKPKMMEYFKMQPNVCNLNNKIRKARNLL